jgi:hypothetical protein
LGLGITVVLSPFFWHGKFVVDSPVERDVEPTTLPPAGAIALSWVVCITIVLHTVGLTGMERTTTSYRRTQVLSPWLAGSPNHEVLHGKVLLLWKHTQSSFYSK